MRLVRPAHYLTLAISTALIGCGFDAELSSTQRELMSSAFEAEQAGDYDDAARQYRAFANKGIPEAQFRLGRLYSGRVDSLTDGPEAVRWLEAAAKSEHEGAAALLARIYDDGDIVPRDNAKAAFYYRRVLDSDDPSVAYRLAELMLEGRAGVPNVTRAVGLLSQSARKDYGPAYKRLAEIYEDGEGSVRANAALSERYWNRYANVLIKDAAAGDARADQELGQLYLDGKGVARDPSVGLGYMTRAAESGRTSAQRELGKIYLRGATGIRPDPAKGEMWLERAIRAGDSGAMRTLGDAYRSGTGVAEDHAKAKRYYEQALSVGDEKALARLGDLLRREKSPVHDAESAFNYNSRAATAGDAKAMFFIGEAYEEGNGVATDQELALFWYRTSDRSGYRRAGEFAEKLSARMSPAQIARVNEELSRI